MRTRRSVLLNCLGEIVDIVLIIFGLTIQGSYAQNVETAAIGSNADTVQFLI